jgi:hypothetical protein
MNNYTRKYGKELLYLHYKFKHFVEIKPIYTLNNIQYIEPN